MIIIPVFVTCDECDGKGYTIHPMWKALDQWMEANAGELQRRSGESFPEWQERLEDVEHQYWVKKCQFPPPQRKVDCSKCNSTGTCAARISLDDLRKAFQDGDQVEATALWSSPVNTNGKTSRDKDAFSLLTNRARNALRYHGINSIEGLERVTKSKLGSAPKCGAVTVEEIAEFAKAYGIIIGD